MEIDFAQILTETIELNASDLHMTVGSPPVVRIRGDYPPTRARIAENNLLSA